MFLHIYAFIKHILLLKISPEEVSLYVESKSELDLKGLACIVGLTESNQANDLTGYISKANKLPSIFKSTHSRRSIDLLNLKHIRTALYGMLITTSLLLLVYVFYANWFETVLIRWLLPFSNINWPQEVYVQDTTQTEVAPIDSFIEISGGIEKGYQEKMRVWVSYQFEDERRNSLSEWRKELLRPAGFQQIKIEHQAAQKQFSKWIEEQDSNEVFMPTFRGVISTKTNQFNQRNEKDIFLRYRLEAGDDVTSYNTVRCTNRPQLNRIDIHTKVPQYSRNYIDNSNFILNPNDVKLSNNTIPILENSQVSVSIYSSKSLKVQDIADRYIGLNNVIAKKDNSSAQSETVTFVVRNSDGFQGGDIAISIEDLDGLRNTAQQNIDTLHISIKKDELPTISIYADGKYDVVTPNGTIPVYSIADDDIGIDKMWLSIDLPIDKSKSSSVTREVITIKEQAIAASNGRIDADIDLKNMQIKPGEYLEVYGMTQDVYMINDQRHDKVTSRKLKFMIVDKNQFIDKIYNDLGFVRQHAVRIEQQQEELLRKVDHEKIELTFSQQKRIHKRIEKIEQLISDSRIEISNNRIENNNINQLLDNAKATIQNAKNHSQNIVQTENIKSNQIQSDMEAVLKYVGQVVDMLGQRDDMNGLQIRLKQMQVIQQSIMNDTHHLLPRTIGETKNNLDKQIKNEIDEDSGKTI